MLSIYPALEDRIRQISAINRQMASQLTPSFADPQPSLSSGFAAALSVSFTLIYVLPFYISPTTRPSPTLSRDNPAVIRARIRCVAASCVICTLLTLYVLRFHARVEGADALHLLGWWWSVPPEASSSVPAWSGGMGFREIARALLLVATLFAGPLFEAGVAQGRWRRWIRGRGIRRLFTDLEYCRDYIAGPVSEELIFRSLLVSITLLSPLTARQTVFVTPLYFGVAHVHHLYERRASRPLWPNSPPAPLLPDLAVSLVQFAYTTLFGWLAAFVFVRTASLPAAVLLHSFCNWMGLPRFWGRVEPDDDDDDDGDDDGPELPLSPSFAKHKGRDDDRHGSRRGRTSARGRSTGPNAAADATLGIGWTVLYYVLLVAGAVAFARLLWLLTESERKLAIVR